MCGSYPTNVGFTRCRCRPGMAKPPLTEVNGGFGYVRGDSVERVAARAGAGRVRVVDREALLLDRVHEVDRGTLEVRRAHPVRDDAHTVEVGDHVTVEVALVE